MKKRTSLALWLGLLCAGMNVHAATTGTKDGVVQNDETVTMALGSEIRGTNPGVNRDDTTDGVTLHMVEGLVGYRINGDVAPLLAKDYSVSSDGLTYTFHLRSGVKFQNGDPLNSAAVLWSWQRYLDPKTSWSCLASFDGRSGPKVVSMSTPDDMTFVMKIDHPSATFLSTMAETDCGEAAIIDKASLNADGTWNHPIGTGPYKFGAWHHGQDVILDRYDGYVSPPGDKPDGYVGNKTPQFAHVRFMFVPDAQTSKAAVETDQVDATNIAETDVPEMQKSSKVHVVRIEVKVRRSILFNTTDPVLKDPRVRRGLAMLIDVDNLVAGASNNQSKPNGSMIYPASSYYDDVQKQHIAYDVAQGKALLKAGGYTGQQITILADNRPITPLYNIGLFAQQMLQSQGVNAKLEVADFSNLISRWLSGNYQMLSLSFSSRMDPSGAYAQAIGAPGSKPFMPWQDPKAIALLKQSNDTMDHAARQKLFDQLHELMLEDMPVLVLYNGLDIKAVNNRLSSLQSWEFKPLMWTARLATH